MILRLWNFESKHKQTQKKERLFAALFRGDGGSRTLVQTRNPDAFYTLIFHLRLTPAAVRKPPKPRAAFRLISHGTTEIAPHYLGLFDTP